MSHMQNQKVTEWAKHEGGGRRTLRVPSIHKDMASFALSKAGFVLSVCWCSVSCKVCSHPGEKQACHYNNKVMKQIFLLKNCSMVKHFQEFSYNL
jgi:hypothetical protein